MSSTPQAPTVQFSNGQWFEIGGLESLIHASRLIQLDICSSGPNGMEVLSNETKITDIIHDPTDRSVTIKTIHGYRLGIKYSINRGQYTVTDLNHAHMWIGVRRLCPVADLWTPSMVDFHFHPRPYNHCRQLGIRTLPDLYLNMDQFIDRQIVDQLPYRNFIGVKWTTAVGFKPLTEFHCGQFTGISCYDFLLQVIRFMVSAITIDEEQIECTSLQNVVWLRTKQRKRWNLSVKLDEENNFSDGDWIDNAVDMGPELLSLSDRARPFRYFYYRTNSVTLPIPSTICIRLSFQYDLEGFAQWAQPLDLVYDEKEGMRPRRGSSHVGFRLPARPVELVRMLDKARMEELDRLMGQKRRREEDEQRRLAGNRLAVFNQLVENGLRTMSEEEKVKELINGKRISYHPVSYLYPPSTTVNYQPDLAPDLEEKKRNKAEADDRWRRRRQMLVASINQAMIERESRIPAPQLSSASSSSDDDPFPTFSK